MGGRDYIPPLPPSERGTAPDRPDGVGLFRLAGWGWGFTIALFLVVGSVMLIGYLRDDPGRNPAPAAYRVAVCDAFAELSAGTEALELGSPTATIRHCVKPRWPRSRPTWIPPDSALAGLPDWEPGRSLNELLGSQIITLSNGAAALESGPAEEDLEVARTADAQGRRRCPTAATASPATPEARGAPTGRR